MLSISWSVGRGIFDGVLMQIWGLFSMGAFVATSSEDSLRIPCRFCAGGAGGAGWQVVQALTGQPGYGIVSARGDCPA